MHLRFSDFFALRTLPQRLRAVVVVAVAVPDKPLFK